jgi:hypothetical protein
MQPLIGTQTPQHGCDTVERTRRLAARVAQIWQRMESTIQISRTIYQKQ